MVDFLTAHASGARQTIYPDTGPPVHFFGARRIFCLGTHLSDHSFGARQVNQPDASRLIAHSFEIGHKKACCSFYHSLLSHTSAEIVVSATKTWFSSFQAIVPAKASCRLLFCQNTHSSELGLWDPALKFDYLPHAQPSAS